MDGTVG